MGVIVSFGVSGASVSWFGVGFGVPALKELHVMDVDGLQDGKRTL